MSAFFGGGDLDGTGPGRSRPRRAFWAGFGLLYLVPLARTVAGYSGPRLVWGALALVVFIGLYMATPLSMESWTKPVGNRTWVLLGTFAVVSTALPFVFGAEWIGSPIYLATTCAMTLPMRWVPWGVAAAALISLAQCALVDGARDALPVLAVTALSLGMFMFAFRHARTLVQQLREARGEVARLAAADERLRIARDLHDLLGNSLSLIVLKSELARRVAERDPARTITEINDIESVARESLADVRAAISGYRRRDLTGELDGARAVLAAAEIGTTVRTSGTPLPGAVDGLFGWAVREGVTNVVRHSRAAHVHITVTCADGAALLEVADDGCAGTDAAGPFDPGNGLTGLTERVAAANGTLEAGPVPGGGFRLAVRVPLAPGAGRAPVGSPS
ncbi:sensor histidine kinase [Spirillospora sp. NBC_01491]|uniref:sensor histidine kinase n=1 Tax=Spirillospora sp. NBC_01491 TaxID=2976007 RepID=UPI002E345B75|nr:sensor histidine kinase [Spirillospora sp. NBC_01491]